VTGKQYE